MENIELKYKYVVCNNIAGGYYDFGYKDFLCNPSVAYFPTRFHGQKSFLAKILIRLTFSKKINKIIKEPFRKYTFRLLFPHQFNQHDNICYVFFGSTEEIFQSSYIQYLRKYYPNVKIVLYMQDIVKRNIYLDVDSCRHSFDLLISYDRGDCEKYNMLYYPTPMSYYELNKQKVKSFDLYYCGRAKQRYELLYKIYEKATQLGMKCDFYLFGLPENAKRIDGINYPTKFISYDENLKRMIMSRCVIDLMQESADGFTPRVWDSIINDRHLLTDNEELGKSSFYSAGAMHMVSDFLKCQVRPDWIDCGVTYTLDFKKQLTPNNLLKFIENHL